MSPPTDCTLNRRHLLGALGAEAVAMLDGSNSGAGATLAHTPHGHGTALDPLRATLEPRVVRNLPVYVGSRRGYSIAALEKRGVGYAVATDLNDRESAELVASIQSVH